MEKLKITPPEGYEIDKEKSSFEEIIFRKIESKLPKKWEDLKRIYGFWIDKDCTILDANQKNSDRMKSVFPTKQLAEAALALSQLLQLRDIYNDGWENIFDGKDKYVICVLGNKIEKDFFDSYQFPLTFKTPALRDEFFDNFQELLKTAKPLL